jgi:hypothetical protein
MVLAPNSTCVAIDVDTVVGAETTEVICVVALTLAVVFVT